MITEGTIVMVLHGKRALVTGASRGIGAAIAKKFAAESADVAITYEKSGDHASEVVRAVQSQGRKGVAINADSADVGAVQASIQKAAAELSGLDILANNAEIIRLTDLRDTSVEDIEALINVPGPIDTDMNPTNRPYSSGQVQLTALGRYRKPEEIADAVAFLSSLSAQYITGTSLTVDGGLNA